MTIFLGGIIVKKIYIASLLLCLVCFMNGCAAVISTDPSNLVDTSATTSTDTTAHNNDVLKNIICPTAESEYFELLCENLSANIYLGSGGARFLEFWLISTTNLEGKILNVGTDLGGAAQIEIPKAASAPFDFPFYVFVAYQDFPWGDYAHNEGDFTTKLEQYEKAYNLLKSDLPQLFTYRIQISFEQMGITADVISEIIEIKCLTAKIGDHVKEYNLSGLRFLPDACTTKYGGGLTSKSLAIGGISVDPSVQGYAELPELKMTTKNDVVLEYISFAGCNDTSIVDCAVSVQLKQGGMYSFTWDGNSPIEVDAGADLSFEIGISDPALANKIIGSKIHYMVVHYSSEGQTYETAVQIAVSLFPAPHDIYAMKVDGIDLLSYYVDYFNVIQQEQ